MERLIDCLRAAAGIGCIVLLSGGMTAQVASVGRASLDRAEERPRPLLQTPSPGHGNAAGAPIAGYSLGPGPADVRAMFANASGVKAGDLLTVPATSKRVYLPPRQQYALIEQNSNEALAVWAIHKAATSGIPQEISAINGALPHPDLVSFSPRGESILLYSRAAATLQVVNRLPAEPVVSRSLLMPPGASAKMAVSDDGAVVVVALQDGSLVNSTEGAPWKALLTSFLPEALSFIPKTHDLAVSDVSQKMIVLLPSVDKGSGMNYRVLAQDVWADRLALTRGGEQLMAANLGGGQVWTIDLRSGAVLHKEEVAPLSDFSSLRDGYTFLLSTSGGLSVLRPRTSPSNTEGNR